MEKVKVIIADDQKILLQCVPPLLNAHRRISVVNTTACIKELLKNIDLYLPQVVILSLDINKLNGFHALKLVLERNPFIKVIVTTSYHSAAIQSQSFNSGAHAYIPKECGMNILIEAILAVQYGIYQLSPSILLELSAGYKNYFSEMESRMVPHFCKGKTTKEVAKLTNEKEGTVKTYRTRIYEKAGVKNTAELIYFTLRNKVLSVHEIAPLEEKFYKE